MTTVKSDVLLPKSVVPTHYDLTLEPQAEYFSPGAEKDPKLFTFNGFCEILLDVHEKVKNITCHAVDLCIQQAMLRPIETKEAEEDFTELSVKLDEEKGLVMFVTPSAISSGRYRLSVIYTGTLNDQLCGFYRSSYKSRNGETRWLATTQFEATDARKALPCWDEPAVKAIFKITLVVPPGKQAISNMNIIQKETLQTGAIKYHYAPTPKMSSYLAAVVIGDFDYISMFTPTRKVEIRVYTQPGYSRKGHFALQLASDVLEFYEKYFGIEYPLTKMDLLAIPDFAAGAMENWGCVTYREIRLLADDNTSFSAKLRIARTVAHEIAHMWFGNLVTMDWWTYLWLNEGFARFMEHFAVDAVRPEWRIWDRTFASVYHAAQKLDAMENSHPVEVTVNHPEEVEQIFDAISYAKGSCIVRQVYHWVGAEAFQQGIIKYLKKFAYGSAVTEDLWAALEVEERISNVSLLKLNEEWVKETGYPVILAEEEAYGDGEVLISLKQKRFFATGTKDDNTQEWKVPIHILTGSGKRTKHLMMNAMDTIEVAVKGENDWIKLNAGQTGFFRVKYGPKMLARLSKAVVQGELLCEADRLGLLSDMCAFSSAGMVSVAESLNMIEMYRNETKQSILTRIASFVAGLTSLHEGKPYEEELKRFKRDVFASTWELYGWEPKQGEDPTDAGTLRNLALAMQSSDQRIQSRCIELVKQEASKETQVHPDIRTTVYNVAVRYGGKEMYEVMKNLYLGTSPSDAQLYTSRLCAMYRVRDPELIKESLEFRKENVSMANQFYPTSNLCTSAIGRSICWQNFKDDQEWVRTTFMNDDGQVVHGTILGYILKGMVKGFSTSEKFDELNEFFDKNTFTSNTMVIKQGLEQIQARVKQIKEQSPVLVEYFNARAEEVKTKDLSIE